ncbi:MAG TPA: hypothetical protein VHC48_14105 [Puia sp.]|nr:hypothetical protein [Puia sp.]
MIRSREIHKHPGQRPAGDAYHTYLRLSSPRHEVLHGFEETDILPYGGLLEPLRMDATAEVISTFPIASRTG